MVNKVYVVTPRGFCAGVEMAIKSLIWLLKIYDETIYCYHEIVHNDWIVEKFRKKNVVFVNNPSEIPKNSIVMLSAHGTAPNVENEFNMIALNNINSVCPLVTKVHHEAKTYAKKGKNIIYIGHKGHDESVGTMGVAPKSMNLIENLNDLDSLEETNKEVALLAQTTLALSEWEPMMLKAKEKFPNLILPRKNDLCYATTNRQKAILNISKKVDCVLVVGSESSSNTNALVESIRNINKKAYRVEKSNDLINIELENKNIAITAGASAPDHMLQDIIKYINPKKIEIYNDATETEYFPLPVDLRNNINDLSNFIKLMFPNNDTKSYNGIKNDKSWSATEALISL